MNKKKNEGTSKNSDFFVRERKLRTENRSLHEVNEDKELMQPSRKKRISRGALDWKKGLYAHYTQAPEKVFPQFKFGAVLFFIGLVIIYAAYQLFSPSLAQELITLLGLFVIGLGFLIAMLAQLRMLIGRILRFIRDKPYE